MKVAVVVLADPGKDESLGRVYNALETVTEFKKSGDTVRLYFGGAGTRWLGELAKPEHPANSFYEEARDVIGGTCSGCAAVFSADEGENGRLLESQVSHPDPSLLQLYTDLHLDIPLKYLTTPRLEAVLDTPRGKVKLKSPDMTREETP